jgi:hypothetical protein
MEIRVREQGPLYSRAVLVDEHEDMESGDQDLDFDGYMGSNTEADSGGRI